MDKTMSNLSHLFRTLINPTTAPCLKGSPSARFETDKYLAHTFFLPDINQSPALIERDVQIMTMQMGLLSLDTAPAPRLEDFASAPSRDKPKKTGQNLKSGGHIKCPDCNEGFDTYMAMFSHIRVHQDKGSKGFKNPSIKKPKPKPNARPEPNRFLLRKLNGGWTVIKNQSPREVPDRKIPEDHPASILFEMSKSTCNCHSEKSRMVEFSPFEEEVAAILDDLPNLIRNCRSRKRRMPESARLENKKQRKNAVSLVPVKLRGGEVEENSDMKAHVCEICGKGFEFGYKLGGHKRAHYKNESHDQN